MYFLGTDRVSDTVFPIQADTWELLISMTNMILGTGKLKKIDALKRQMTLVVFTCKGNCDLQFCRSDCKRWVRAVVFLFI